MCYASFLFELRTDGYKMLTNTRRPRYQGAQDIGSWQHVLLALGVMGVFTNVGLIGYTSTAFSAALPMRIAGSLQITEANKVRRPAAAAAAAAARACTPVPAGTPRASTCTRVHPLMRAWRTCPRGTAAQVVFLLLLEHALLAAQYLILVMLPDRPEELAKGRAKQRWRKRAAVELHKSGGRPLVVDGSRASVVRPPPCGWDDEEVPDRFWRDANGLYVEPRQVREMARLLRAGEWRAEQQAIERAKLSQQAHAAAEARLAEAKSEAKAAMMQAVEARAEMYTHLTVPDAVAGGGGGAATPSPTKRGGHGGPGGYSKLPGTPERDLESELLKA